MSHAGFSMLSTREHPFHPLPPLEHRVGDDEEDRWSCHACDEGYCMTQYCFVCLVTAKPDEDSENVTIQHFAKYPLTSHHIRMKRRIKCKSLRGGLSMPLLHILSPQALRRISPRDEMPVSPWSPFSLAFDQSVDLQCIACHMVSCGSECSFNLHMYCARKANFFYHFAHQHLLVSFHVKLETRIEWEACE